MQPSINSNGTKVEAHIKWRKIIWGYDKVPTICRRNYLAYHHQTIYFLCCWCSFQIHAKTLWRTLVCCKKSSKVLEGDSRLWTQVLLSGWFQTYWLLWFRLWQWQGDMSVYLWIHNESWINSFLLEITQAISYSRFNNRGRICGCC